MRFISRVLLVPFAMTWVAISAQTITAQAAGANARPNGAVDVQTPFAYPNDSWFRRLHPKQKSLREGRFHYSTSAEVLGLSLRVPSFSRYQHH